MRKHKDLILGLGFMAMIGGGIALLMVFGGGKSGQTASLVASLEDQKKGNSSAGVTLVEYSDFQCPACGAYFPLVKKLTEEFGDQVQFIYRHYPIFQIHRNANGAAWAAEAAGKQGKFWEMHDLLFTNQAFWSESPDANGLFETYASQLGLDPLKFKSDMNSEEVKEKVRKDYQSGVEAGIAGTPTFFLNGTELENPRSYEQFKAIILSALNAKS